MWPVSSHLNTMEKTTPNALMLTGISYGVLQLQMLKANCGNCTSDQDSCKTEDNVACVFPFEYDGNTYTECTDVDNKKKWCATAVDAQGRYIDDKWGYCGDCTPGQGK